MKFGVSAFAWTAKFQERHLPLLAWAREAGFDGFEIAMFAPGDLPASSLRQAYEESGLECTVCAILPAGINPISPDASVRRRSIEHLIECVETAAEIGSHLLGGPLFAPIGYLPPHRPTGDEMLWAIEAFQAVGESLDEHDMTLSLEPVNRAETFFIRTAAEARALCDAIGNPRIGVTIDTFHANIEEKSLPLAIESLGPQLKHIHISENDRGVPGTGHVGFPAVIESLKKIGYQGYLTVEGFGYCLQETDGPGWLWAETGVTPEDVAVKGLAYLKGLLK
ncbi:sugar phosphate isomerase/epimerase family protein [Granulicella aggregans]|uniref:sugar phosphate isomerase/epimerase family protein n=1 Tax=Granulicella aggregans TaxID=474949 RepID=UPI0021E08745|nr:sugar phosphate isomerase/epimerase family protein [Granulicella aggregans]